MDEPTLKCEGCHTVAVGKAEQELRVRIGTSSSHAKGGSVREKRQEERKRRIIFLQPFGKHRPLGRRGCVVKSIITHAP